MGYAILEALAGFRRAPLLTSLSAAMVGLALFVMGLFALSAHNLREALEVMEERVEVVAYLLDGHRPDEVEIATGELGALSEVESVRYVSKDEALRVARSELPELRDVSGNLDFNPFPASLEIRLRPTNRNPSGVERVARSAAVYPFVEDVSYGEEWVQKLFNLRRIAAVTAAVLGGAFAAVAALIIGTAVRIAVFARRDEIYVMKLVGAKDGFIRRPFLLEGAITGVLGGVVALFLTRATYEAVDRFLFAVSWIPTEWAVLGVLGGVVFGTMASALALRRHLREV